MLPHAVLTVGPFHVVQLARNAIAFMHRDKLRLPPVGVA
jgi:hypothetical protein